MRPVVLGASARAEILATVDWYEAHAPGTGGRFVDEFQTAVTRIAETPLRLPVIHKDVRRARLRRFPYGVFFPIVERAVPSGGQAAAALNNP
jgi:plasmid stabilization system protein ParE